MGVIGVKEYGNSGNYTAIDTMKETRKGSKKGSENSKDGTDQISNGTLQASKLNLVGAQDSVLKKLQAQKVALKNRIAQFEIDSKTDHRLKEHADNRNSFHKEALSYQKEVKRLDELKNDMKESFGVQDDSEEQKDLELLEKQAKGTEPLSDEELDRLENMEPLTEYQNKALKFEEMADDWRKMAEDAGNKAIDENRSIISIKLALLKKHPMLDAKQESEAFVKQVDDEIMKEITEEIKEKVDDNLENDTDNQMLTNPQTRIEDNKFIEEELKGLSVNEQI